MDISVLVSGKTTTAYNKACRQTDFNKFTHNNAYLAQLLHRYH